MSFEDAVKIVLNNDTVWDGSIGVSASGAAPSNFKDLGANATALVKSGAGRVYSLACYNENASARYLQLHDLATVATTTSTPVESFLVPSSQMTVIGSDYFTANGVAFSVGVAFAFSTTRITYTAGAAAEQSTFIKYL